MYTDSLTSHTTASDSTTVDLLTSTASVVEDSNNTSSSATESQFSSIMPYLEESTQPGQTQDSVFTDHSDQTSSHVSDSIPTVNMPSSPSESPAPHRSTRSTRGVPLCNSERCI